MSDACRKRRLNLLSAVAREVFGILWPQFGLIADGDEANGYTSVDLQQIDRNRLGVAEQIVGRLRIFTSIQNLRAMIGGNPLHDALLHRNEWKTECLRIGSVKICQSSGKHSVKKQTKA